MDKYRLIIFGNDWDVYQVAYKELIDNPRFTYIPSFRPKGMLGQLQRIQFNPKLNSIVSIPFKHIWNSYLLRNIKGDNLCFFIQENWLKMECGIKLLSYLRHYYPTSKIVCFTQDIIETIKDHYSHRPLDVEYMKRYADLFISYDKADAEKHQVLYHPTFYSLMKQAPTNQYVYDLFFLGRDKGRLHLLVTLCKEAQKRGLTCKFLFIEVPKEEQVPYPGITYLEHQLPYKDNLLLCSQSKCIVELLQQKASSPTFRTWETIALNRKLLSNNTSLIHSDIYDKRYISTFHNIEDIDWDFITTPLPFTGSRNPYEEKMRPEGMIQFIEDNLKIKIDR